MPQVADSTPKHLRPYKFHGVQAQVKEGNDNAYGECPFCGREGKFSINVVKGVFRCLVCNATGNPYVFIRRLHQISMERPQNYEQLAKERGLLNPNTLKRWGVCKSIITGDWLFPGYNHEGKLTQLYKYTKTPNGKRRLLATAELTHGIYRPVNYDNTKETVYVCEGPWDACILWECMQIAKPREGGGLSLTGSVESSLLGSVNVVAVPGCNVFSESWVHLFGGKHVVLMYDSDHPKEHPVGSGYFTQAGYDGMCKVSKKLAVAEAPPQEITYLSWGEQGYDSDMPSGYDVRDYLTAGTTAAERIDLLDALLLKVENIPSSWLGGEISKDRGKVGELELLPCSEWKKLINTWRLAMKWTEGLETTLAVMLSSILSVKLAGDQLWLKIIGPPSCGKSVLCEAISANRKYILAKSSIRGFHSGYKSDKDGSEDHSLIPLLKDKTLITKDGDTLLIAPNRAQILGEARDLYDCVSRAHYRHGMNRNYEGIRMTWILCGTESLRELDDSELGQRFLDCVVADDMDIDLEREIGWRVALRTAREMTIEVDGKPDSREGPEMVLAKQITGGYVAHLRENAKELVSMVDMTDEALRHCQMLAEFVSFIRARPSKKQQEKPQRELSFRLTIQLVRLANCLAAVLNKTSVDIEVLARVRKVALDTARGRTYEIVRHLHEAMTNPKELGLESRVIALYTNQTTRSEQDFLFFLRKIGAVSTFKREGAGFTSCWYSFGVITYSFRANAYYTIGPYGTQLGRWLFS